MRYELGLGSYSRLHPDPARRAQDYDDYFVCRVGNRLWLGGSPRPFNSSETIHPTMARNGIYRNIWGTPVLVQALFIFYGLPQVFGGISPIEAGIAAIALNSSAYFAEVIRGGVKSIDYGQTEAALASGLSRTQTFRYVVWPQAVRRMIPGFGDLCIVCIKDTSVFSIIGVGEIVRQGQIFIATNFKALEVYLMVAVLYMCVTVSLAIILRAVERHIGVSE